MSQISINVPQPFGLKFTAWGALVAELLARYGVASPVNEDSWKSWVCVLFYIPELVAKNIPTPDQFSDWQSWADHFVDAMR